MEASKKRNAIILAICAIAVIVIGIVANIHKCDICEETYIGKQYTIDWFGEELHMCKDCHDIEF